MCFGSSYGDCTFLRVEAYLAEKVLGKARSGREMLIPPEDVVKQSALED